MKFPEGLKSIQFKRDRKYSLVGNESFLKEQFVSIAKSLYPTCLVFYPESKDEALAAIESQGLFSEDRLLVLQNANKMDPSSLSEALEKFTDGTVIFSFSDDSDLRTRVISELTSKTSVVECNQLRPYGDDYPRWVSMIALELGYEMRDGSNEILYASIGPCMQVLYNEIKKLVVYKGDSKNILPVDVKALASCRATSSAYDILEYLLKKDVSGCLEALSSYCRYRDDFVELVSFLGSYFEKLYRMAVMNENGMSSDNIAEVTDIPRFLIKTKYLPKAAVLGRAWFSSCLEKLVVLDARLRLYRGSKRVLVERYIMTVAS